MCPSPNRSVFRYWVDRERLATAGVSMVVSRQRAGTDRGLPTMSTSVSSPISVDTGGTADDVPALVDIGFHPAPVRTTRSRWVPIGIATFAGLTCLGLATTTFFPSVTDRGSERD